MELPLVQTLKGLRLVSHRGSRVFRKKSPTFERRLARRCDNQRRESTEERGHLHVARILTNVWIEQAAEVVGVRR